MTKRTPRTRSSPASASRGKAPADPVTAFAAAVVAGTVVAGHHVRAACARHLRDLETGPSRGLRWNPELDFPGGTRARPVDRVLQFFPTVLRLNGGEHEGRPFHLEPWQQFVVGSLFGWVRADGYRRFRVAFIETAKGSGKSPLAAGIGHYMLVADGEARAEVYAAATKKDQAQVLFRDAVAMVEQSPALSKRLTKSGGNPVWNLAHLESGSFFRPISSEDDGQSGPRPHCALLDEVHEHKSDVVIQMMRAGTKGRRQALIFEITNSGFDRHSICYQHHEYSEKILQGSLVDDGWFAYICGLDPCATCAAEGLTQPKDGCAACDDWRDPTVWPKANPSLGVTIRPDYLADQVREAVGMPAKQNLVKRLNFCIWTEQATKAIDMTLWDLGRAPIDLAALRGQPCYAGLDLAQVNDLSSLALVFPIVGAPWPVLWFNWVPAEDIAVRAKRDRVPYDVWVRDGVIATTPGNTTDYGFIQRAIVELAGEFDLREIAFDRAFSGQIIQNLQAELGEERLVAFGQGFLSMGAPTAEVLRRVKAGELQHGNNPVARWAASNLSLQTDAAGNLKPDKERSTERIDPMTALIMAVGRATVAPEAAALEVDFV